MKQINFSNVLCSIILGISIILGCLSLRDDHEEPYIKESKEIVNQYKPLMTIEETAEYLNISELQVRTIISSEETMLKVNGSYSGKMFPVIKIGNDIYISANDLNEWLKDSTMQRKQY